MAWEVAAVWATTTSKTGWYRRCWRQRCLLYEASANGRVSAAAKHLNLGANSLCKDQQDRTALDLAAKEEAMAAFAEFCDEVGALDLQDNNYKRWA